MKTIPQIKGCLPRGFNLDSLLTPEQFALWQGVSVETARDQLNADIVPHIKQSKQIKRIHPRTFLDHSHRH